MSSQRPTMLDVAALAGVGLATVSRVVNEKPGVSASTAARVRAAMATRLPPRRAGIEPAPFGSEDRDHRACAGGRCESVHVGAPSRGRGQRQGTGMLVFAGSCDEDSGREREFISALRARRVDGIIVVPAGPDHSYLLPELRVGTAIVFVDRPPRFATRTPSRPTTTGTFMAVSHLVERGHERIAYLGADPAIATAEERLPGATGTRSQHTGSPSTRRSFASGFAASRTPSAAPPGSSPTATGRRRCSRPRTTSRSGAYRALRARPSRAGRPRPGFDDFALAEMLDPPVTVVAHDPAEARSQCR